MMAVQSLNSSRNLQRCRWLRKGNSPSDRNTHRTRLAHLARVRHQDAASHHCGAHVRAGPKTDSADHSQSVKAKTVTVVGASNRNALFVHCGSGGGGCGNSWDEGDTEMMFDASLLVHD
jgi:hypothetical protein